MAKSETPHVMLLGGDGGFSGVPTYIEQVATQLVAQHRITVVTDKNIGGYDFTDGLGAAHLEVNGLATSLHPVRLGRALRGLAKVIDRERPDVIWAHARMSVLLVRLLAILRRVGGQKLPLIVITHHGSSFGPGHKRTNARVSFLLEKVLLRLGPSYHHTFLSHAAHETYLKTFRPALTDKFPMHVLMNCSDLGPVTAAVGAPMTQTTATPAECRIVMTGRYGYQKNYPLAAQILKELPDNFTLTLCGNGTDSIEIKSLFESVLGQTVRDRVRFVGPVPDVTPHLAQAELFLLTSHYEGMPIAALEAFEVGLPLASSQIAGMAEIAAVHPLNVTFPTDNPHTAAAAIVDLVDRYRQDPAGNRKAAIAAWDGTFSLKVWEKNFQQMWRDITASNKP